MALRNAIESHQTFITSTATVKDAIFFIGVINYEGKHYDEALRFFDKFVKGYPGELSEGTAKDYIRAIRPDAIVVAVQDKLEGVLLKIQLSISNFLIDCTDSPKAQFTMYNACKEVGFPYIRAGYDGTRIMVTGAVSGWIKTDVEEENYEVNPSWVVPAQIVAALAVGKMLKYHEQEVSLDISEIGIPILKRKRRLTARCVQSQAITVTTPRGRPVRRRR